MAPSPPQGRDATGDERSGADGGWRWGRRRDPVPEPDRPLELAHLPLTLTRDARQVAVGVDDHGVADGLEHREIAG